MKTRHCYWPMWVGTVISVLACSDNGNLVAAKGNAGDAGNTGSGVEVPASGGAGNTPAGQGGTDAAGARHTTAGDTGGAAQAGGNHSGGAAQTTGGTGGTAQAGSHSGGATQADAGGTAQAGSHTGGTAQAGSHSGGATQAGTGGAVQAGGHTGGGAQAGSESGGAAQTGGGEAGGAEPLGTAGAGGATVNPPHEGVWYYQWLGDNISFIQIALCDAGSARFLHAQTPTDPEPLILEGTYVLLSSPPDRFRASFEASSEPSPAVTDYELTYDPDTDTLSRTPASDGYDSRGVRFDPAEWSSYATYLSCE